MTRRAGWQVLVLVLAMAVAVAGCSAGDGEDEGAAAHGADAPRAVDDGEEGAGGGASAPGAGGSGETIALPEGEPISLARSLVFNADVVLEADDVGRAADRAVALAEAAGGFAGHDSRTAGEHPAADLVLRVPAPRFSDVLEGVTELGEVESQSASAEDVTDQVVDLEGRIATARASVERLRGFLDDAGSVQDIATLEGELARRESDLESLEGRLAVLDDQVRLSTISLTIEETGRVAKDEDYGGGFVGGLRRGWDALVAVTGSVLVVSGALVPFLPFAAAAVVAWRFVDRRRRTRRVAPL